MDDFAGEFDNHWTLEDEDYEEYIEMDRQNRLRNLNGKYVITCIGNKSKKKCYLQDRNINNGGWWTQYLSNAIGYNSEDAAIKKCKSFKYNNCKVERVI